MSTSAWANPGPDGAHRARRDCAELLERIETAQKAAPLEMSAELEAAHERLYTALDRNWGFGCDDGSGVKCPSDDSFVVSVQAFRAEVVKLTARVTVAHR